MTILRTLRNKLRAWKIDRLEQDRAYAVASSSAHIRGIEQQLTELRREQWMDITADDIARRMDSGKLA